MRSVILASSSGQRQQIFANAGIPFAVEESKYQEDMTLPLAPQQLVQRLARGKAEEVAKRHADAVVIGADTIVVQGSKIFGKPLTAKRAGEMLRALSGGTHEIVTGFAIVDTKSGKSTTRAVGTTVRFRALSNEEIDAYVKSGEPLDKAGGYAIQSGGKNFVEQIDGEEDNARGLPLKEVLEELAKFGVV